MTGPKLRAVVVGAGAIARRIHLPHLTSHDRIGEVLVLDTDETAAHRAVADFGVGIYPGDLGVVPADLAVVCTPPRSHAKLIMQALRAGMDVVCEKPLATSRREAEEIERFSRYAGRRVFACYTNRFRPDVERLRDLVRSGALGKVREVSASWSRRAGLPRTRGGWESGVLWDLGAHLVDVALWCTGWSGMATAFATGVRPIQGAPTHTADWYDGTATDAPPPEVVYETVTGLAHVGHGTLHVRASWDGAVAKDSVTVRMSGSGGVAELRTVFGFSPDRLTVSAPCLRLFHRDRCGWHDVLTGQSRQPDEYRRQLDEALRAGSADGLRAAVRSVLLCEAFARSLDEDRAITTEVSEEAV